MKNPNKLSRIHLTNLDPHTPRALDDDQLLLAAAGCGGVITEHYTADGGGYCKADYQTYSGER